MGSLLELLEAAIPLLPGELTLLFLIAAPASMAWRLHRQRASGTTKARHHENDTAQTLDRRQGRWWAAEAVLLLPYGLAANMAAVVFGIIALQAVVPPVGDALYESLGEASDIGGSRRAVWTLLLVWPVLALPLTLLPPVIRSRGPVVGYLWLVSGPARVWLWVLRSVHWNAWRFLRFVPLVGLGAFAIIDTSNKWHNQYGRGWTGQTNNSAGCVLAIAAFFVFIPYYAIMLSAVMVPTIILLETGDQDGGWYAADFLRRLVFGPADLSDTADMAGWAFLFAPLWLTISGIAGSWARRGVKGPWREFTAVLAHLPLGEGAPMAPYSERRRGDQQA